MITQAVVGAFMCAHLQVIWAVWQSRRVSATENPDVSKIRQALFAQTVGYLILAGSFLAEGLT
tara:strand:- start:1133 stop:1321 length:189 start_codon:yes stop_codon:yes gene_type:complete